MNKLFNFGDGSGVFFTSDTHWGHANIIRFCSRPFVSVEEMNDILIQNWNNVVPKDGIVFHLGDFAFGGSQLWNDVLSKLNEVQNKLDNISNNVNNQNTAIDNMSKQIIDNNNLVKDLNVNVESNTDRIKIIENKIAGDIAYP